jgi:uncharacterized protein (TIGR01777 family)
MIVAISGSSGLIGSALVRMFGQRRDEVRPLVRRKARAPNEISWNPEGEEIDVSRLEGVDVVINLAGENLAQHWSTRVKQRIRDSRVKGTALLSRTIASLRAKPRVFLSGSAIGIYGSRRDEPLDEASTLGDDFLARVCKEWEEATAPASDVAVRVTHLRTGLVLSTAGGLLPKLLLPFRLGIGGKLGKGRQWMSWISLVDYAEAVCHLATDLSLPGAVNIVSPNPVTNEEFTDTLANVLRRPAVIPVPSFALKFAMGEMAEETALASQRVRPHRLLEAGFPYQQPTLDRALRTLLNS